MHACTDCWASEIEQKAETTVVVSSSKERSSCLCICCSSVDAELREQAVVAGWMAGGGIINVRGVMAVSPGFKSETAHPPRRQLRPYAAFGPLPLPPLAWRSPHSPPINHEPFLHPSTLNIHTAVIISLLPLLVSPLSKRIIIGIVTLNRTLDTIPSFQSHCLSYSAPKQHPPTQPASGNS